MDYQGSNAEVPRASGYYKWAVLHDVIMQVAFKQSIYTAKSLCEEKIKYACKRICGIAAMEDKRAAIGLPNVRP